MSTGVDPSQERDKEIARLRYELALVQTQLEQLQLRKSTLLAMVAHDLRTPLAIIQGYSQLLAAELGQAADPAVEEYIANILAYAEALGKMIDNLIALDQFELDEVHLSLVNCDLNDLTSDALAQIEGLAGLKNLKFQYRASPTPALVLVDEDQLRRAIFNLLSHTTKYARPESELFVEVDDHDGYYHVQVIDVNRTLPADVLSRLFDPGQIGHDGQMALRGMDLGLVLTGYVAERHGGHVAASGREGSGVNITLILPAISG